MICDNTTSSIIYFRAPQRSWFDRKFAKNLKKRKLSLIVHFFWWSGWRLIWWAMIRWKTLCTSGHSRTARWLSEWPIVVSWASVRVYMHWRVEKTTEDCRINDFLFASTKMKRAKSGDCHSTLITMPAGAVHVTYGCKHNICILIFYCCRC